MGVLLIGAPIRSRGGGTVGRKRDDHCDGRGQLHLPLGGRLGGRCKTVGKYLGKDLHLKQQR
jgi:hypothetical protein